MKKIFSLVLVVALVLSSVVFPRPAEAACPYIPIL